ncbi:hypothetical protein [Acinetobacter lwoffii]|uniref:hypothetical protein n=1 Tax=Acinetobacter lwoffii TaxID=28090 RepID=UPI00110D00DE|nr:hypothetical protein [Acinetobacter lwoffii]TMS47691.1 hypothetical protein FGQ54_09190 [Acinetobacter lwoffii]
MNQDQYCNMLFESFYDAMATCDEHAMNIKGDQLFNFLVMEMLQNSSGRSLTFSDKTGTTELHTFLDAYQRRLEINTDVAETLEAEIYSNISSYSFEKHMDFKNPELREKGYSIHFKPIQIKAVIDWLDLAFEVDPSHCSFAHKPNARSYIKSFLTMKTGKKHYVKHDDSDINQEGLVFTVRLHDIKSKADLLMIADLLEKQYGAEILRMKIRNIELSLDFYNANNRGLLSALHKSLRYQATANNFRIYKYVKADIRNKFNPVPHSPLMLLKRFNHDWCLGVNPKGSPLCYRLYVKTTDSNKQPLPKEEHRLRVEVTLDQSILKENDCSIENLQSIIKQGFKFLTFTELDKKSPEAFRASYEEIIKPYGQERAGRNVNRNKRNLEDGIKTYAELNSIVSKAIFNLCRKF